MVEAARGPGASMYGDSAVGGVLQVLTEPNAGVRADVSAGSFHTYVVDAAAGHRFSRFGLNASGAARRTRGFSTHSFAREVMGSLSADGPVGAAIWRWTGSANSRRREDSGAAPLPIVRSDPTFSDPTYRFDDPHRHGLATSFVIQHSGDSRTGLVRLYGNTRDDAGVRTILLAPGVSDRRRRAVTAVVVGATAQGGSTIGRNKRMRVQSGIDLTRDRLTTSYQSVTDAGQVGNSGPAVEGHRFRAGVFASSSWDASAQLRLTGALRWDGVADQGFSASPSSHDHTAWSPRIGVTFRPSGTGKFAAFAQASKAFKVPTLDQLFDPRPFPDFRGGTFTISNATLRPQRAASLEAGISGSSRVNWSLLVYRMNVDDEIDFDVRTFSYGNIGRSRHTGVEAEATGRAWAWLDSSAAYAWTHVAETGDHRQLKNVPRHTLVLSATVTLPRAFGVYGRYRGVAGAFLDDENTVPLRGLSTFDVRLRRTTGGKTLFVDVLNLADARYEEYRIYAHGFSRRHCSVCVSWGAACGASRDFNRPRRTATTRDSVKRRRTRRRRWHQRWMRADAPPASARTSSSVAIVVSPG